MFRKIKEVLALPSQIEAFRQEISSGLEEAKKLREVGTQSIESADALSKKAELELDEARIIRQSVDAVLSKQRESSVEQKKAYDAIKNAESVIKEIEAKTLRGVREESSLNQQTIQSMLRSTNEILRGINEDRTQLERIRVSVDRTLVEAKNVLAKSEDAKRQAQLMLAEVAEEKGQLALITDEQKMLAAMALNLCTASVSKIIASGDNETMEQEYNAILNNLNLQVIPHDDALLETLRKLLDTINFFRLQEGDRKRLEARYSQRMNNLIWNSLSSIGGIFVMAGPNPWAAAAGAAIMAGSMFVGYHRKKGEAKQEYDEEIWRLERSALEQLHALRASLFETAWRLSDSYKFDDTWRLTTKQIEWYNEICSEPDHAIRYKKLEQYQEDFQVYPYYWYELGVAAQNVHHENSQSSHDEKESHGEKEPKTIWRDLAEKHLKTFIDLDRGHSLLRQDVIGADARIRHVSLVALSKGWEYAISNDKDDLECVKRLAVDDPELLLKAALVYASGLREMSKSGNMSESQKALKAVCEERAIAYFEKLVYRGNNLPISSIILSKLYLDTGKDDKYDQLLQYSKRQIGKSVQLVSKDGSDEERQQQLACDWSGFFRERGLELSDLFERQFDIAMKMAHPSIFNGDPAAYPQRMEDYLQSSFDEEQKNYKFDLFSFWEKIRTRLNDELKYNELVLGLDHNVLRKIANDLNNMSYEKIAACSEKFLLLKTDLKKENALLGRYIEVDSWLRNIGNLYVMAITQLAAGEVDGVKNTKEHTPADLNALLSSHVESMVFRNHLTPFFEGVLSGVKASNYFGMFDFDFEDDESKISDAESSTGNESRHDLPDGCEVPFSGVGGREIDYFYDRQMSYTINLKGASKEHRDKLVSIIIAKYHPKLTSYRYDVKSERWYGKMGSFVGRWVKRCKAGIVGETNYIIAITDEYIKVEYTKRKADENIREVKLLSCRAVERELERLGCGGVQSDKDKTRFKEVVKRWLEEQKKKVDEAVESEKKDKVVKSILAELKKRCKDPDAQRLIAAYLQLNCGQLSFEVDKALLT